jgi:hypothetical protein
MALGPTPSVSEKVYWIENLEMSLNTGTDSIELEMSGRYYDPDFGYITISTVEPFVISYSDS